MNNSRLPVTLRAALALLAILLFADYAGSSVQAHAFIDHTQPAVGGTVKTPPTEVRLWFTVNLEEGSSRMRVMNATGEEVNLKDTRVDPKDHRVLSVSLPPALPPGAYKVIWRAVSADTHVTEGDYTFQVE